MLLLQNNSKAITISKYDIMDMVKSKKMESVFDNYYYRVTEYYFLKSTLIVIFSLSHMIVCIAVYTIKPLFA